MAKTNSIDQLERALAVVIARARTDEEFARQLHEALSPPAQTKSAGKKSTVGAKKTTSAKPPKIEIPKVATAQSVEEIRDRLRPLTRTQIYALIQAQKIAPTGTSKLNKHQLIEHVIRNKKSSSAPKRSFAY